MVLQSSGAISFSDMRNEMNNGATGAITFSAYKANGTLKSRGVTGIPVSGSISLGTFRGKTAIPVVNGLIAKYTGESWTGTIWTDETGGTYNASTTRGIINSTTGPNSKTILYGATTAGIQFPVGVLPTTYTMFFIARYNGSSRLRIIDGVGTGVNYLSGFHGGISGVAYHEGWVTNYWNIHNDTWMLATDQNTLFRSNQQDRTSSTANSTSRQISVNYGNAGESWNEYSDWAIACMLVYDRTLSSTEILQVENYLKSIYTLPTVSRLDFYTVMTKGNSANWTITNNNSDPNVYLQLNSSTVGGSGTALYMNGPNLKNCTSVVVSFDIYIPTTAQADGMSFYIGATSINWGEGGAAGGWTVGFQVYTGGGATRGVCLYNSAGTKLVTYGTNICNSAWTFVKIIYTKGTTNTWQVYYGGNLIITQGDTDNSTWAASSGQYWGFGCRTGGLVGDYYVGGLSVSYQ